MPHLSPLPLLLRLGPTSGLATRSGPILLLSLPAGPTVGSVPPDSHLSLSLFGFFPARAPPVPSPSRAHRTPVPGRCCAWRPVPSPLCRSADPSLPLPPFFSFPERPNAFPFANARRSSELAPTAPAPGSLWPLLSCWRHPRRTHRHIDFLVSRHRAQGHRTALPPWSRATTPPPPRASRWNRQVLRWTAAEPEPPRRKTPFTPSGRCRPTSPPPSDAPPLRSAPAATKLPGVCA
jgi:hypothetical protein